MPHGSLTGFERWILKWILRKITQKRLLKELFFELRVVNAEYFFEDNHPTQENYLFENYIHPFATPTPWFKENQFAVIRAVLQRKSK